MGVAGRAAERGRRPGGRHQAVSTDGSEHTRSRCGDISAELDRRAEAQHIPAAQGVTVCTLHSAKGLEWDAVALLGIHEGSMPFVLASSAEQIDEEQRLLYVGITRARRLLRISWSRTRNGNGHPRTPSRFLQPVLPELTPGARPQAGRLTRRSRHSALSLHCRSCGRSLTDAAERKIGRHLGCPATYDERTMAMLKEWRRQEAAEQKLPAYCVFTDATLIAIAEARPRQPGGFDQGPGARSDQGRQIWRARAGDHRHRSRPYKIIFVISPGCEQHRPMREQEPTKFPQKSAVCVGLRYSPRVNKDLYARPSRRPPIPARALHERRSPVLIDQISDTRTVQLTLPELQLSLRALMPDTAVVTHHLDKLTAHAGRGPISAIGRSNRTDWRGMGEVCVQSIEAAAAAQGGRNAGHGAYDVTDSKFSTSMGPPSCSPPV